MQRLFYISFFLVLCSTVTYCQNGEGDGNGKDADAGDGDGDDNEMKYDRKAANLTKEMFKDYNHLVRPCGQDSAGEECKPVDVTVNIKIMGITSVDDSKMHFNMQFLLRQEWLDERLKHAGQSDLTLDTSERQNRIWTPDTFFLQEKDAVKSLTDQANNQYRISPDGQVHYSTKLSITLACPMNLQRYPFDIQECYIQFGSYAQTKEQVHYKWNVNRAIEIAPEVRETTPGFTLGDVNRKECKHQWVTGAFSCLKMEIQFKRQFGFADLMKNFIPSFVLVVLSWLAFFLGSDTLGVRALLGAGCLQFLLIHWSILSLNLPHVAGFRAIDVWFIACILFVAFSLLQLLLVIRSPSKRSSVGDMEMVILDRYADEPPAQPKTARSPIRLTSESESGRRMSVVKVQRKYTRLQSKDPKASKDAFATGPTMVPPTSQYFEEPDQAPRKTGMVNNFRRMSGREKADAVARVLFPSVFALFNLAYWIYY